MLTREPVVFKMLEPHLSKFIEIRAFPQFDREGEFTGLIHFVRDISDKRIFSDKCCE
jgi:DUF438 domain-containing protein